MRVRLDDLQNGYWIYQDEDAFCFGMDAVLLSGFAKVRRGETVCDLGAGNGILPILLAAKTEGEHFTGLEIRQESVDLANRSIAYDHLEDRITMMQGDLCEAGSVFPHASFDVVVSNPPYICESEKADMRPNVLDFEPHSALFVPDNDPLVFYRRIASLHWGRYLFFEINEAFGAAMQRLLAEQGYTDIHITNDIYGKQRIIEGRMVK